MNTPQHIVIVPDGNRRWAKRKGKTSFEGHAAGDKAFHSILETAINMKIPCVTAWGSSVSNITDRSKVEVAGLFKIFEKGFRDLLKHKRLKSDDIRVRILGRWDELFPAKLRKVMHELINSTKNHKKHNLTFLMAYDGRDEMQAAITKLIAKGKRDPSQAEIKESLWAGDLPPVDLVIRTGGEPHWSAGMMMWDVAEARLYFTETLWPDFAPKEFEAAVHGFSGTERRHGR